MQNILLSDSMLSYDISVVVLYLLRSEGPQVDSRVKETYCKGGKKLLNSELKNSNYGVFRAFLIRLPVDDGASIQLSFYKYSE